MYKLPNLLINFQTCTSSDANTPQSSSRKIRTDFISCSFRLLFGLFLHHDAFQLRGIDIIDSFFLMSGQIRLLNGWFFIFIGFIFMILKMFYSQKKVYLFVVPRRLRFHPHRNHCYLPVQSRQIARPSRLYKNHHRYHRFHLLDLHGSHDCLHWKQHNLL